MTSRRAGLYLLTPSPSQRPACPDPHFRITWAVRVSPYNRADANGQVKRGHDCLVDCRDHASPRSMVGTKRDCTAWWWSS